jgi:hypothetical protein
MGGGGIHGNFGAANMGRPSGGGNFVGTAPGNFAAHRNNFAGTRGTFAGRDFDRDHDRRFRRLAFNGLVTFGGPAYYGYEDDYDGCWQQRLVPTPFGWRWRLVQICEY